MQRLDWKFKRGHVYTLHKMKNVDATPLGIIEQKAALKLTLEKLRSMIDQKMKV